MRHLVERETAQLTDDELLDLYDGCAGTEQRDCLRGELRRRMSRPAQAGLLQNPQGLLGGLGQLGIGQGGHGNG